MPNRTGLTGSELFIVVNSDTELIYLGLTFMDNKHYTTRLQKGGALLNDMRLLVRSWDQETPFDDRRMDHWPDRVKEKCKTDKSLAIALGLA